MAQGYRDIFTEVFEDTESLDDIPNENLYVQPCAISSPHPSVITRWKKSRVIRARSQE